MNSAGETSLPAGFPDPATPTALSRCPVAADLVAGGKVITISPEGAPGGAALFFHS